MLAWVSSNTPKPCWYDIWLLYKISPRFQNCYFILCVQDGCPNTNFISPVKWLMNTARFLTFHRISIDTLFHIAVFLIPVGSQEDIGYLHLDNCSYKSCATTIKAISVHDTLSRVCLSVDWQAIHYPILFSFSLLYSDSGRFPRRWNTMIIACGYSYLQGFILKQTSSQYH